MDTLDTVSVNCVVSKGDVPIEIIWLFEGQRVTSNDGITVSKMGAKMSTLYIESIRPRHAGNYSCVARNKAGQVEHSSELKVIGNSSVWCDRVRMLCFASALCKYNVRASASITMCRLCILFVQFLPPYFLSISERNLWIRSVWLPSTAQLPRAIRRSL